MRTCRDCSTLVGKYKLYCEPCRIERRRVVKRGTYRRLGLRVFECAQCGSSFEATHKRKYCTKKCSSDAQQVGPRQKLDHIIPLSKRGTHTYDNVQLLCRRCNCHVKNNKISVENTLGGLKSLDSYYPETSGHRNFSARNV